MIIIISSLSPSSKKNLNNYKSWLKSNDNWFELGFFLEVSFPLYYLRPKKRGFYGYCVLCLIFHFSVSFLVCFFIFTVVVVIIVILMSLEIFQWLQQQFFHVFAAILALILLFSLSLSHDELLIQLLRLLNKKKPIKKVYKLKSHEYIRSDAIHLFGGLESIYLRRVCGFILFYFFSLSIFYCLLL